MKTESLVVSYEHKIRYFFASPYTCRQFAHPFQIRAHIDFLSRRRHILRQQEIGDTNRRVWLWLSTIVNTKTAPALPPALPPYCPPHCPPHCPPYCPPPALPPALAFICLWLVETTAEWKLFVTRTIIRSDLLVSQEICSHPKICSPSAKSSRKYVPDSEICLPPFNLFILWRLFIKFVLNPNLCRNITEQKRKHFKMNTKYFYKKKIIFIVG